MSSMISPTEFDANRTLRTFLQSILPEGVEVIRGQANRVPEPNASDFVVMTPIRRTRLATNIDNFIDTRLIGNITGSVLTITTVDYGSVKIGSTILGVGILPNTTIIRMMTGSGGIGQYEISKPQTITEELMAAGVLSAMQPTEVTVQLDVHGPESANNAQRISTMLRDDYAWVNMTRQNLGVYPLTAEDPKQIPFINAENQYEDRWVVEACLQVNAAVEIPQEFFEQAIVGLIEVDTHYPP